MKPARKLILLAALALLPFAANAGTSASQTVNELHSALLQSMQAGNTLSFVQRSEQLRPTINGVFNFSRIARILTGQHWRKFSEQQQQDFIQTFARLVVANYADRFDAFNGEQFRQSPAEDLKRGRKLVRTHLVKKDGETVSLDYILDSSTGDWRILNVIAEGVSDLALKRADYGAILRNSDYHELRDKIEAQIHRHTTPDH